MPKPRKSTIPYLRFVAVCLTCNAVVSDSTFYTDENHLTRGKPVSDAAAVDFAKMAVHAKDCPARAISLEVTDETGEQRTKEMLGLWSS